MTARRYRMHGYDIESHIDLHMPWIEPCGTPADLVIEYGGRRSVPRHAADGETLAHVEDEAVRSFYSLIRRDDQRMLLRFLGAAEIELDRQFARATAFLDPAFDPDVLSVIITGTVMACKLVIDGRLVLHASAVEASQRALAFVGASGMGKSTLSTLACAAGLPLVADDVLRVDSAGDQVAVWPGAAEARLRPSAAALTGLFEGRAASRQTADARTAISPSLTERAQLELAACVVPFPSRTARDIEVRWLTPFQALTRLAAFPRVGGWREQGGLARQFQLLADMCEVVPVVEAVLPWGPPFVPGLITRLLDILELN